MGREEAVAEWLTELEHDDMEWDSIQEFLREHKHMSIVFDTEGMEHVHVEE